MVDRLKFRLARERIAEIKGFYIHALVFVLVVGGLVALNIALGAPYWALWVLIGWGLGLGLHAALVFGSKRNLMSSWERRKLRELIKESEASDLSTKQSGKPAA